MIKTKPILMSSTNVEAINQDRKTQTRRTIKNQPGDRGLRTSNVEFEDYHGNQYKPEYKTGDILWVRETWAFRGWSFEEGYVNIRYKDGIVNHLFPDVDEEWIIKKVDKLIAKGLLYRDPENEEMYLFKDAPVLWEPSIFMPKWASRFFLEVTNVRVERLQDISEDDAIAEGVKYWGDDLLDAQFKNYLTGEPDLVSAYSSFMSLWDSINGPESSHENPWVWVYDFKKIEKPKNFI